MAISDGLRRIIDDIHAEMRTQSDPKAVAVLGRCLQALTNLQQQQYEQPNDARSALLAQLGGQGLSGPGEPAAAGGVVVAPPQGR